MAKFDVDTAAKLFIAKSGVTSFDVKVDLYSDAKEHWLLGGQPMGFEFPIRTIGGDPVGGGKSAGDIYFLRGGWKIRPQEADHTLLVSGNLFLDEGETGQIVVPTVGDFTVTVIGERSNLVLGIETGAPSPSQQDIRDAMTLSTAQPVAGGSVDGKLAGLQSDTDDIQARLPAELVSGRMNSHAGSVAAGALTAAAFAAEALNAISDALLNRNVSAVEAASAKTTVAGIVLKLMSKTKLTETELEIYRTNGTTLFGKQPRTIYPALKPTGELGVTA